MKEKFFLLFITTFLLTGLTLPQGCISGTPKDKTTTTTVYGTTTTKASETPTSTTNIPTNTTTVKTKTTQAETTTSTTSTTSSTTTTTQTKLEIPPDVIGNCVGFLAGAPEELKTIGLAGGGWARPHPGPFNWESISSDGGYDFTLADEWVRAAQENNIALLGTIWPYSSADQKKCHGSECAVSERDEFRAKVAGDPFAIYESRCMPCNMDDYADFLRALVERYDGDGVDDMPGLTLPVRYWEVLNEPFLRSETLTFFKGTAREYREILEATYSAIKEVCSDCVVLHAGAAHTGGDVLGEWRKVFQDNGTNFFDVGNIHYISSGDHTTMNVRPYKNMLTEYASKPVWLTEAEIQNVKDLDAKTEGALDAGADKIFYTQIVIGGRGPPKPGEYTKEYEKMKEKCEKIKNKVY